MSLKNYQCSKCYSLLQKETSPNSNGCPEGGSHNWHGLGEVGMLDYQCTKCGTMLKSKGNPVAGNCSKRGSHNWHKL